uniref:Ankyrin repeat domain-containing protein n=1 Tax=Haptolina brevifila TaxID=156173 RepID=A0A7S2B770_9EUKA|mmetsp:Transcript_10178/g.20732  ORF Transcript_10178/g.20732 Transcript_10178/m.20732 type:complete len:190 (+) Transcript_10178:81-650(+)
MPSYIEIATPLVSEHRAEQERKLQEQLAKMPPRENKPRPPPVDANAKYFEQLKAKGLVEEPKPLPTEDELQASYNKFMAMSPADVYKTEDPAEQLFQATKHMRDDHVVILLQQGAPTTYADRLYGYTPLHIAAVNGRAEMVANLIDAGAAVDIKDKDGNIPLALARKGHHEVAIKILEMATPAELRGEP